ncbi:MAG: SDR family oxidoreductase [Candidatus Yanofskybacteria bacterium]|nr:SDR family oxidoreductase [Candidatus Yanofskybacteria bacterium]
MFNIARKVCVITGGAGLIGSAFCRACAENGAKVVIIDTNPKTGKNLAGRLVRDTKNKNILFQQCDITKPASVKRAIKNILKKFRRIDALVNCAYPRNKNYGRKFEDVTYEDFCDNLSTHLGGYFLMTKEVSRTMKEQKGGSIVLMGSIYGIAAPKFEIYEGTHMTMPVEYAAIKGGIVNLARYLASYLGPHGIRVNAISPGGVFDNQPESFVKRYVGKVKLAPRRMAKQEDVAGALLFLLSDASAYITGQNIVVDGGWTI